MTRYALSASSKAQLYLLHVTLRVKRSVRTKFHADWSKAVGARVIHTDRQTDGQTVLLILYRFIFSSEKNS